MFDSLRGALARNEFVLHYQPLHCLRKQCTVSSEALLRWRRSADDVVGPADFIPILEKTGLIVRVGARVLDMACGQLRRWRDAGVELGRIAVNLSAVQFERDDLVRTVEGACERANISPEDLDLEITETAMMEDTERTSKTIKALKDLGARIAIDDFGAGFSSLSYLHRFPADVVKLDRSFMRDLVPGGPAAKVVGSIIGLVHDLGMEAVAEGVETLEQRRFLENVGCDVIQGFLYGEPKAP